MVNLGNKCLVKKDFPKYPLYNHIVKDQSFHQILKDYRKITFYRPE